MRFRYVSFRYESRKPNIVISFIIGWEFLLRNGSISKVSWQNNWKSPVKNLIFIIILLENDLPHMMQDILIYGLIYNQGTSSVSFLVKNEMFCYSTTCFLLNKPYIDYIKLLTDRHNLSWIQLKWKYFVYGLPLTNFRRGQFLTELRFALFKHMLLRHQYSLGKFIVANK